MDCHTKHLTDFAGFVVITQETLTEDVGDLIDGGDGETSSNLYIILTVLGINVLISSILIFGCSRL